MDLFCKNPGIDTFKKLGIYDQVFLLNTCIKISKGELLVNENVADKTTRIITMIFKHIKIRDFPTINDMDSVLGMSAANYYLKTLTVSLTGATEGDLLIGISNVSNGAIIKIHGADILPEMSSVLEIKQFPGLYTKFLGMVSGYKRFQGKSIEYIREWFEMYCNPGKRVFIGEDFQESKNGPTMLELIAPGTSNFSKLISPEKIEELMSGKKYTLREMENFFPRKPGSKAVHPTLMFIKHWWKVAIEYTTLYEYDGICIDLYTGDVMGEFRGEKGKIVYIVEISEKSLGFISGECQGNSYENREKMQGLISEMIPEFSNRDYDTILREFTGFTPASYKSLLQKLIRFRSPMVMLSERENSILISSKIVLLITLAELILSPGSFVPDIQRFVSGVESAAKRLAVSIFEDSSFSCDTDSVLLLGAALLAQNNKKYRPSAEMIKKWFSIALLALENPRKYHWETDTKYTFNLSIDNSPFKNASWLIDKLKSFESDLNMISYIAEQGEKIRLTPEKSQYPSAAPYMPICHGVDQHWMPDIAYYFDPGIAYFTGKSLQDFYWKIFFDNTGKNPRKKGSGNFSFFENDTFVQECRKAQWRILEVKQGIPKQRKTTGEKYTIKKDLEIGWIAGLAGVIEFDNLYITLRYDDPYQLAVARRPTRELKDGNIPEKEYENAVEKAKGILRKGIPLDKASLPSEKFKGCKLVLSLDENETDEYFIRKNGVDYPWDKFKKVKEEIPVYYDTVNGISNSPFDALKYNGAKGISENAWDKLEILLGKTCDRVLNRVCMYISSFSTEISLNHLNRQGTGLHLAVNEYDLQVYYFLLQVSLLFPGALSPKKGETITFIVNTPLLYWEIKGYIIGYSRKNEKGNRSQGWGKIENIFQDNLNRKLWEHQGSALEEMKTNYLMGNKGHFIFIPCGLGKSLIALLYLKYLYSQGKLPKYVIYTCPSSAMQSVIKEMNNLNIPVNLHIPLKSIKNRNTPTGAEILWGKNGDKFQPYCISLIEHDHLRRVNLSEIAVNSVVITDEVHKTLSDTQRTSAALEISYISHSFIAMTGTPVIDDKIYKLLAWLKQIVPFELNEKNFWVAVNNMISRRVNTGVIVNRHEKIALFNSSEQTEYSALVSPALGGYNKNPGNEQIREAIEICYKACTRKMVEQILALIVEKRGVMVVAKNREHQEELKGLLIGRNIRENDIFLIEKGASIFLTDDSVKEGNPNYKIVITTVRSSEGYTLTRLNSFVSSVYFSNNAVREQLEGRINRIGQSRKEIDYYYVHCGVLSFIRKKYKNVKSLAMAIEGLAKHI